MPLDQAANCGFRSFRVIRAETVAMCEAAAGRGRGSEAQDEPRSRCFKDFHASLAFSVFVVVLKVLDIFISLFSLQTCFSHVSLFLLLRAFLELLLCQDPVIFPRADGFLNVFDFAVFMISSTFCVLVVSRASHAVCFTRSLDFQLVSSVFLVYRGPPRLSISWLEPAVV